jgi:hypothetical protein
VKGEGNIFRRCKEYFEGLFESEQRNTVGSQNSEMTPVSEGNESEISMTEIMNVFGRVRSGTLIVEPFTVQANLVIQYLSYE